MTFEIKLTSCSNSSALPDELVKERTAAKNSLESYSYSLKQQISENGDKFEAEDKEKLNAAVEETIKFLEENSEAASVEEINDHKSSVRTCFFALVHHSAR